MNNKIPILYLRQTVSLKTAGGANKIILETIKAINTSVYHPIPVFIIINPELSKIVKHPESVSFFGVDAFVIYGNSFLDFKVLHLLQKIIAQNDIKIIHSNEYKSNVFALILKLLNYKSIHAVTTIHGFISNTPKSKIYIAIDKLIIPLFDKIILVSSPQKLFFRKTQKNIELIHNFIDTEYWFNNECNQKGNSYITIGFSGRISKEKGWADFVEIAKRLVLTSKKNIHFAVAGNGPDRESMENLVESYSLKQYFTFLGTVTEMRSFYSSIDILLAPSHTEGLPVAQLEANAMSIPIVATNVGGVGDLIIHGQNGFLASKHDIDNLVKFTLTLVNDSDLCNKMGSVGKKRVSESFSSKHQIKKLETVYTGLLRTVN